MSTALILVLFLSGSPIGGVHRPAAGHAAFFAIAHAMLSAAGSAQTSAPDSAQTPPATPETPSPSQNPPAADQSTSSPSGPSPTAAQAPADGATADAANASAKSSKGKSQSKSASSSKKSARKSKATPAEDPSPKKKVVVKEGGTKDNKAELSPTMTSDQVSHARLDTTQLLASTDTNLQKIIGRQLNTSQQATLQQIHAFMQQAKDAADKGDLQRAHNLAQKAQLLSDDLAGH